MTDERQRTARLVALFLVGCAVFVAPLLRVFSSATRVAGMPLPWVYLFAAWTLFIVLVASLVVSRRGD